MDLENSNRRTKKHSDYLQEEADRVMIISKQREELKKFDGPTREEEVENQKELIMMHGYLNKVKKEALDKFEKLRQKAADKLGIDLQKATLTLSDELAVKIQMGRLLGFNV